MSDHSLFPDLTPPPGGLNALRSRLEPPRQHRYARAMLLTVVTVGLLVFVLQPGPANLPSDVGLVAYGLYQPSAAIEPTHGTTGFTVEVRDPDVVFYRVAAAP